jgi:acrylyl-CoA reductase (NADPH)
MVDQTFKALVLRDDVSHPRAAIEEVASAQLPGGDVTIAVQYSSLNYKDALAITGRGPIVRSYPMIPGIDASGIVERSGSSKFREGDHVVLTGWGVGENRWGGFAKRMRLPADFLVSMPKGLGLREAMEFGTAGLTAMLCVQALERHGIDREGPVLVTGAGGGVGSIAVSVLARLGYAVQASSGRPELQDYLTSLGATEIVARETLSQPQKPLASEKWVGAVDTVGGTTLASVLASVRYRGAVAACGLAGGANLPATVMPFILRNVALLGIDSVRCPLQSRIEAWRRLAELFPSGLLQDVAAICKLDDLIDKAPELLDGNVRGRVVVDVINS